MTKAEYERMIIASGGYTTDRRKGDQAWVLSEEEEKALDAAWRAVANNEDLRDEAKEAEAA